jgi:hypothetical protein
LQQGHAYQKPERLFSHLGSKAQEQVVLVLIGVCTSIYDLNQKEPRLNKDLDIFTALKWIKKDDMSHTLSRTALASIPNLSAIGTMRSGRLKSPLREQFGEIQECK